jgi:hypothetical protein
MNERLGYVVIVYNQASRQPDLVQFADLHWDLEGAVAERDYEREQTASVGRGETYDIAEVVLLDPEEQP